MNKFLYVFSKLLLVISSLIFYFARNVFISNPRLAMPSRVFKCSIPGEAEQVLAWSCYFWGNFGRISETALLIPDWLRMDLN